MDVKFDADWLAELVKAVESENPPSPLYQGGDKIGIAQSKILLYPKNNEGWKNPRINSLGNIIHFLGFGFTRGYNEVDKNPPATSPHPSPSQGEGVIKGYASGCSFIIKKEVIEKIGGYNEEYYMYHDDLELGWKTRLAGYKIVLAPKSIVYHKYEFSRSVRMLYYMERNRHLAIFTYYRLPTIILILPALLVMDLGMLFYSIINGWFFTKLKICFYFLNPAVWLKIFRTRKEIKKLRVKKDREIIKDFSGEIKFQEIANPVLKYIVNPALNIYWKIIKIFIFW
jgi:GT2 family glycosyltransferase